MAEYIKREAVLNHGRKMLGSNFRGEFWATAVLAETIRSLPAADVVEVVRCKDCKYAYPTLDGRMLCGAVTNPNWVSEDHFCSYGERKEK